jgi:hypothetical protein
MPAPDTEALLDQIDAVRTARGSVALFDALVEENSEGVANILALHVRHPCAPAIGVWLEQRGQTVPKPPTVTETAERLGITDLESLLAEQAGTRARLVASTDEAWKRARRAENTASAYAAVLVLVSGAAVVGWLAAVDALPIRFLPDSAPVAPDQAPLAAKPVGR